MKYLTLMCIAAVVLTGCAREAVYADHEYGAASMDAYNRQIVHKDFLYAHKDVEGMEGLHAEPIMDTYQKSFSEGFTIEDVYTTSPGSN